MQRIMDRIGKIFGKDQLADLTEAELQTIFGWLEEDLALFKKGEPDPEPAA